MMKTVVLMTAAATIDMLDIPKMKSRPKLCAHILFCRITIDDNTIAILLQLRLFSSKTSANRLNCVRVNILDLVLLN